MRDYARSTFPRPGIPFADAHAAVACAAAGDGAALDELAHELSQGAAASHQAAPTVLAIADGFSAFARADFETAIARLRPALAEHVRIGGSRAQRDLIELTLLAAYLRSGRNAEAEAIAARRPARRERIPVVAPN